MRWRPPQSAKDLLPADKNGLSDPYAVVKLAGTGPWRSHVKRKTLHPVWNQTHEFEGHLKDFLSKPLEIKVFDRDFLTSNDPIGYASVSLRTLNVGPHNALTFENVPLEGVPHGSISFGVSFKLKPVFSLFPGTPVHASAAQALRRPPPPDASRLELFRDDVLLLVCHKAFLYMAILWLIALCGWGILICVAMFASMVVESKMTHDKDYNVRALDRNIKELNMLSNMCIQALTGLFSYLNLITLPWRVSIGVHQWLTKRSCAPGMDFYGRPTEAIWFHIAKPRRAKIVALLLLSTAFHFATQGCRIYYHTHDLANNLPGSVPVNLTFISSVLCSVVAGVIQGKAEGRLKEREPERYPPGLGVILKEVYAEYKAGKLHGCLSAYRVFIKRKHEKEEKWHVVSPRPRCPHSLFDLRTHAARALPERSAKRTRGCRKCARVPWPSLPWIW